MDKNVNERSDLVLARELILTHGWNSTAFQIVNPGIERWFAAAADAVIGFVRSNGVRVVVGAPVCKKERLGDIIREFEAEADKAGERVCYFAAESRLETLVSGDERYSRILLGAQPVWKPPDWPAAAAGSRSMRAQLNRARNKGVKVEEWPIEQAGSNKDLADCLTRWLATKGLPPLRFMVESDTLERLAARRVFVAKHNGTVAGFVVLSPVVQKNGWLFEQFPHRPGAPNGTVELMIDTAMRTIADDGFEYATLGLSPLSCRADVPPQEQQLWLRIFLGWIRKHGQRFYNFDGLDAFKAKLMPLMWEPVFAVSNEPRVSLHTLYAIAGAFSGNAPIRLFAKALGKAAATEARWAKQRIVRRA